MSECLSQAQSDINLAIDIESQLVGQNRALGVDIQNVNKPDYNDPKVQNHKNKFESWLNEHYEKDGNTSFVLKRKDYDEKEFEFYMTQIKSLLLRKNLIFLIFLEIFNLTCFLFSLALLIY